MKKTLYGLPGKLTGFFLFPILFAFGGLEILYSILCKYCVRLSEIVDWYGADSDIAAYWKGTLQSADARAVVGIVLLLAALLALVLLCCSAGRRYDCAEIQLSFFDRIPFEILLAIAVFLLLFATECVYIPVMELMSDLLETGLGQLDLLIGSFFALFTCVLELLIYTVAARLKAEAFWKNTLLFHIWQLLLRALRGFGRLLRALGRLVCEIPLVWKSTLLCICVWLVVLLLYLDEQRTEIFLLYGLLGVLCTFGSVAFFVQIRRLQKGIEQLASGQNNVVIPTERMLPVCRESAEQLNHIQAGVNAAVEQRLRSERFRTELITNVSHDLKTPLTSIINYVDLLKGLQLDNETAQNYIEVLDRQAKRLGKLTTDLLEASKASSGSMEVRLAPTDIAELVRQSLGEYSEKFELSELTTVVQLPESSVICMADGRLLWRSLDNLFSNVCKYAMAGTRVYVALEGSCLTVRNISRDPITLSPDELEERFVRGDSSRSTEGSGLGLSIVSSLLKLMGGRLEITVDGDLFKASVFLKSAEEK